MKKYTVLYIIALFTSLSAMAKVDVSNAKTENMSNPLGLDTNQPRFSWQITSDKKDVVQTAYEILVASSLDNLKADKGDLWNSGKVASADQLWIAYGGTPLKSNQRAYWKVRIQTNKGKSEWSEPQEFGIGLFKESHWSGRWIGLERLMPGEAHGLHSRLAARYLRKEFDLGEKEIKRATAHISGLGLYELYINGKEIGSTEVLKPVPSDYRRTVYYNSYDVTDAVAQKTAIGIVLGNGRMFTMRQHKPYKSPAFGFPKCRINIIVEYADGSKQTLKSDESWKVTADGPIRANNEYDGEEYDARMELGSWSTVGYDDSKWLKAERTDIPYGTLRGQMTPNMTEEKLAIKPVVSIVDGKTIIDFGQNIAGWISFIPRGNAGDTIRIKYAEKLNADGTIYLDNLRDALSEDIYICNGKETQPWHAAFSYHGFRYAQITGMSNVTADDFTALVVSDQMQTSGSFECSDPILNKVMKNAWWGVKTNYKGMPVDCPQRNERQPWLGDRTVGSLGESFLFDNERLYSKWMRDICESQREDGVFSDVAPAFWNYYNDDVTWPAALPFTCDMLYRQFGNKQPIINSYPYIKRWIEHVIGEYTREGVITKDKYGDWCVPPENLDMIHSQDPARKTDGSLISTAYVIRCLQLLEEFATLQGLDSEAANWKSQREEMSKAFNKKFLYIKRGTSVRPGHVLYPDSVFYGNNTATANLLPLAFGLVPDDCKDDVVKNIVENIIIKNKEHVSCGVIGISWLMRMLSENGFADVAYLLATQKTYPSWGYMAENGATTIWELWNGDKANPKMNSGNHVMLLGDLLTWCYQNLGGIRNGNGVAYKHIILKPDFDIQDCSHANVSYQTPYGKVVSNWKKTLQQLSWDVEVPCNTTAEVYLPDGTVKKVGSGKYHFECKIPTCHPAIVEDNFLYETTSFPQCHAGTILELPNGDLLASYFGGTRERNPDVCIWVSRKAKDSDKWDEPVLAADGVFELDTPDALLAGINDSTTEASAGPILPYHKGILKRKACWNPVLYQMPDGEILLFFKIGLKVADWTGWLVRSNDGGKTWSKREPLPKGFIGPVKNKPELINNRLVCGSSTEGDGWRLHFEIYDLATKQWKYVGPIEAEDAIRTDKPEKQQPIFIIQPSIIKLKDARLQVLCRTRNAKIGTSFSSDGGDTWSKVTLLDVPNNQSGTDAVTLKDGRHALIYNNFETVLGTPKGPRTPISIALSDDGTNWQHALTLEDSPISQYSYPAIIQGKDGSLHCIYTWRRLRMAYKKIDLKKLK
ncbi:MAG: family 78 glycoside hydrolase catalytic domain [Prevotella sp.]|nr:family 78 glycoside hydrolase catalytic domain [Prevotella sp.]